MEMVPQEMHCTQQYTSWGPVTHGPTVNPRAELIPVMSVLPVSPCRVEQGAVCLDEHSRGAGAPVPEAV